MTLVVSSHILAELEDYCDRMVIVDHGCIAGGEAITLKNAADSAVARGARGAEIWDCGNSCKSRAHQVLEIGDDARAVVSLMGDAPTRAQACLMAILVRDWFCGKSEFAHETSALEDVYFAQVKSAAETRT